MVKYTGDHGKWTHPLVATGRGRSDEDIITARLLALQSGGVKRGPRKVGDRVLNHIGEVRQYLADIENDPTYDTYNPWSDSENRPLLRGDSHGTHDFRKAENNEVLISTTTDRSTANRFAGLTYAEPSDNSPGIVRAFVPPTYVDTRKGGIVPGLIPVGTEIDVVKAWNRLPETNEMMRMYKWGRMPERDEQSGARLIKQEGEVLRKASDFKDYDPFTFEV